MTTDKTALFVRVPTALAERLDVQAHNSGRSKQDLVTELLAASGSPHPVLAQSANDAFEILSLDEVADLLRVGSDDVLARIDDGDFPARRIGDSWRFSQTAVLSWLAGNDRSNLRRTGFEPGRHPELVSDLAAPTANADTSSEDSSPRGHQI
ncbi:MAG: helix-turn-helix domain-containing protein [Acidimicrobiales bacterium]